MPIVQFPDGTYSGQLMVYVCSRLWLLFRTSVLICCTARITLFSKLRTNKRVSSVGLNKIQKRLYQYINADHYFPNLTEHDREMNKMHTGAGSTSLLVNTKTDKDLEHCLGTLRQGVMCHGDVSVMTMVWGKHSRIPLGDFSNPHQCVNFERLHAWAMQRAVTDALEPGVLVHPKLGMFRSHNALSSS